MNEPPPDRRKNMRELALEIGVRVLLFGVFVWVKSTSLYSLHSSFSHSYSSIVLMPLLPCSCASAAVWCWTNSSRWAAPWTEPWYPSVNRLLKRKEKRSEIISSVLMRVVKTSVVWHRKNNHVFVFVSKECLPFGEEEKWTFVVTSIHDGCFDKREYEDFGLHWWPRNLN